MATRLNPSKGGKPDKLMRDAIMVALNREVDRAGQKTKKLYLIADALVDLAVDGDMQAVKEVNDRVDGKSAQPIEHGVGDGLEALLDHLSGKTSGA
jgi:hypothetical protein